MQNQFKTIFYDGITSEKKIVQVSVGIDCLQILNATTGNQIDWKYPDIIVEEKPHSGRNGVVSYSAMPHARLYLDAENFKAITSKIPISKSGALRLGTMILAGVIIILSLVFIIIPALAPVIMPHIPISWDKKMGDYAARYYVDKDKLCSSPGGDAALKKIADAIAEDDFGYKLDLTVQRSETINAFALPGGKVIILSALLDEVGSQDELIGVLTHEAAHIKFRHGTENMLRYILSSFVIDVFTGGGGTAVYIGYQLNNMKYSQAVETAADSWAVARMHSMQVEPTKFADFFKRLNKKDSDRKDNKTFEELSKYISTHPADSARIENIKKTAKELQTQQAIIKYHNLLSSTEWHEIKQICN